MRAAALALALAAVLAAPAEARWHPRPTTRAWQWQLTGKLDLSITARVYDVDGFTTKRSTVRRLHRRGRRAVCYVSAGSYEPFRPDHASFPPGAVGRQLEGFPDERWLDIRRLDVVQPIIRARLDMCRAKRFDAVEPDNVDGYANKTGFPLTAADQLGFNRWVARAAHARGLAVGLKNDPDQAPDLVRSFDFAVVEQCFEFSECSAFKPFVKRRKAVYEAEYSTPRRRLCGKARKLGFSAILKRLELGRFRRACPVRR